MKNILKEMFKNDKCPKCESKNIKVDHYKVGSLINTYYLICKDCEEGFIIRE